MHRQIGRWTCVALLMTVAVFAQSPFQSGGEKADGVLPAPMTNSDVERANSILSRMSLEQKVDFLGGIKSFYIRAYKDLGVPEQKMSDGPVGLRNYGPSTTMGGIGLAATWDTELVQ